MQINKNDLRSSLIMDFSYHDALITKVIRNEKDITILLIDGWNEGQINELNFINCKNKFQYDLENRTIYQLDDFVYFEKKGWYMSFLVWIKDGLLEKVYIEADNIISKKYKIKENLLVDESSFKEKLDEVKKHIGKITLEELKKNKMEDLLNKIFCVKEKESLIMDINNYTLINEEDLNEKYIIK